MDPQTLLKLLKRASDNLAAAQASIADGQCATAHHSIRGAYDILAYIETKQLLSGDAAVLTASVTFPQSAQHHE
jgi:hypothetical protein